MLNSKKKCVLYLTVISTQPYHVKLGLYEKTYSYLLNIEEIIVAKNDKQMEEFLQELELADFYAFMLRDPVIGGAIDDQTIKCAIACVRNDCYFSDCIVYEACPMKSWRMSLLN